MNKPHKHAALIHAFAEGFIIQKLEVLCCDRSVQHWENCTSTPMWFESEKYRVAPGQDGWNYE